jgi:parallel beta-helix repeat protein
VEAAPKTLTVPDDYSTITDAIVNASDGDTIFVKSGVYYENPIIDRPVSLTAENEGTVVVGSGGEPRGVIPVFDIVAANVKISGFTITSLNYSSSTLYASGINVDADNCTITGNKIYNTYYGIFASVQSSTFISENSITATLKDGIRFCGGSLNVISDNNIVGNRQSGLAIEGYSNTISRNNFENNGRGIGIGASYSVVFGNNVTGHVGSGVYLAGSNNVIAGNYLSNCHDGVYFTFYFAAPSNNRLYHNDFIGNQYNVYFSDVPTPQFWDDGYPTGGNYWDDFTGADVKKGVGQTIDGSDGIIDVPFTIAANNTDDYPLLAPIENSDEVQPSLPETPYGEPDSTVALWHFDEVGSNGVTPDAVGNNAAILGATVENTTFAPTLTEGKVGNALKFNGIEYAYVPVSPSLDTREEVTIAAWVRVSEFKDIDYNVILTEGARTAYTYPTRILGLAFNGASSDGDDLVPQGALRGFILDDSGVLNEIATKEPVISFGTWIYVMFTRSLATGMHIYVNGVEEDVDVISGVQNPTGYIKGAGEIYIGHDSFSTLDEVSVSNFAEAPVLPLWMQWWFWAVAAAGVAVAGGAAYFYWKTQKKHKQKIKCCFVLKLFALELTKNEFDYDFMKHNLILSIFLGVTLMNI